MDNLTSSSLKKLIDVLFPKSRWGNVIYLFAGIVFGNSDKIIDFIIKLISPGT